MWWRWRGDVFTQNLIRLGQNLQNILSIEFICVFELQRSFLMAQD